MFILKKYIFSASFALALLSFSFAHAADNQVKSHLKGKTITYIVGASADGGYAEYAKLIAPFLKKYLGAERVKVISRPAANGVIAMAELYALDTVGADANVKIMTMNSGVLLSKLVEGEKLKFELEKFNWIGKAGSEARYFVVHPNSKINSFQQIIDEKSSLKLASGGARSSSTIFSKMINSIFELNFKTLLGFRGSEKNAVLIKEEVDAILTSESNVKKLEKTNSAKVLVRFGTPADKKYNVAPTGLSFAQNDEQKNLIERISILTELGRLTLASPNLSPELVEELRVAYGKALTDPELLSLAKEQKLEINYGEGQEVAEKVSSFVAPNPTFVNYLKNSMKK